MTKSLLLVLVSLFLVASVFGSFTYHSCVPNSYNISSAVMVPDPAVAGQIVTVTTVGNQEVTISGGYWNTTIFLGPIKVGEFQGQLCDGTTSLVLQDCDCPCPTNHSRTAIISLPVRSDAPGGATLKGHMIAQDANHNQILCLDYQFTIAKH